MDSKNKQILETLQLQPLSEEEKASRHILGRLYGPIATSKESTRNGRRYNAELWDRQLNDDIFNEKIQTKALLLELGHPLDREETDMSKICACIPALPKTIDGDLYAYVDILDTPNGRILKTLCDYGFIPGISSRGSGDIMANDEVDPETFFLETWDIVQLPAVKKARLSMCESVDPETVKLRKALTESYNTASEEDREIMKEAFEHLDIKLEESVLPDIPYEEAESYDEILVEDDESEGAKVEVEEIPAEEPEIVTEPEEVVEVEETSEAEPELVPVEEVIETVTEVAEEIKEVVEADEKTAEAIDEVVEEKKEELLPENNEQSEENSDEDKEAESIEEPVNEVEETSEEAEDNGLEEWVSNLKEMIRQKDLLEAEIKKLKDEKAVSDAEVESLKEELNKYKTGFARVGELAAASTKLEKEVQGLHEQLTQKDNEINALRAKHVENNKLTESVNAHETKVKSLTEKLDAMQKDLTEKDSKLNEQKVRYSAKINEAVNIAKAYQGKYNAAVTHYINSKASMLGVRPTDITSRLNENYSFDDIDAVCEGLLEAPNHFSSSLFEGLTGSKTIRIKGTTTSSKQPVEDDLSDLYDLAGLK